jgi:xanthine/CO dehydrogenase XdhC/CoxF family maturation factor
VTAFISRDRSAVRLDTSLELLLENAWKNAAAGVLATVVATAGSTYRKPGARMLIFADGSYLGLLSGGCLEADLKLHAQEVIDGATTRAVEYDMRGPDDVLFGLGAGCEGAMRVLLEPARAGGAAANALKTAGRITSTGAATCLVTVHESRELPLGTYSLSALPSFLKDAAQAALEQSSSRELNLERGSERVRAFAQFLPPPPHLLVCGAGPDARPVVTAARALGWRVTLVDHRPAYAEARHFPGAAVIRADARDLLDTVDLDRCHAAVVMSHHLPSDVEYLRALARAGWPDYVGLLGPAVRRRRIVGELGPLADELRPRLRGPVGIDIGAVIPEAIALAIVSQVHAYLAGRLRRTHATEESSGRSAPRSVDVSKE